MDEVKPTPEVVAVSVPAPSPAKKETLLERLEDEIKALVLKVEAEAKELFSKK